MSFTPKPTIKAKNSNESANISSSLNKRRIDAEIAAKKLREKAALEKQQMALRRQKEFTEKTHIWNEQILPRWSEVCHSTKVRELCSKGIPPNIRGKVWPLLIGNDLDIDEKMFEELNRKVLMIYGNKVVTKLQGRSNSGEGADAAEENPEEYNPTSTYGLYRDSFDTDDGRGVFEGADFESTSRTVSAARAPSADIPIPGHLKLHPHSSAAGVLGAVAGAVLSGKQLLQQQQQQQRLDVTEESWFENERNGSLDSETFELIQKQLFKRSSREEDQAGSLDDGPGNERFTVENYYDAGPGLDINAVNIINTTSTQVEGIALGGHSRTRVAGSQIDSHSSVDSHFTMESYNVIGSYVDHIKHTSHAIPIKNDAGEAVVTAGGNHYHYSRSVEEGSFVHSEDLNEMSFALVTGGDSSSRDQFTMSISPTTEGTATAGALTPPPPQQAPSRGTGADSPPSLRQRVLLQGGHRGAAQLVPRSFGPDSPHTPPPRRRHSEEYLMDVGLLPSDGRTDRRHSREERGAATAAEREEQREDDDQPQLPPQGEEEQEEDDGVGHPPEGLQILTLADLREHEHQHAEEGGEGGDHDKEQLYCHSAGVTPLKTKQPFHLALSGGGEPTTTSTIESSDAALASALESSGLSTEGEIGGTQRRKSASTLTNLLVMSELQEAAQREEKLRAEREQREKEERAERDRMEKRRLSDERRRNQEPLSPQSASNAKLINTMSLIEWDLPRTFPTLGFFHDGGPMHTGLERILLCYACFRPDIGYVQGMSFLVATLLLYMDEFEAFKCLANLLGRRVNMDFYRLKKEAIDSYVMCFDHFFKKSLPLLYNHMCEEGVTSEMYLMDWNMALFTKALPLEVAAQVWDMYLYEGEMYIMCVGLGILKMYAAKLSTLGVEKISPFLLHLPEKINPDELFMNVSQIQINKKVYERVRKKTAETVRAQFAELEGLKKSRSNGNLQAAGGGAAAPGEEQQESRLGRLHLGTSLKKALRATIGRSHNHHAITTTTGEQTELESAAATATAAVDRGAGSSPLRNNHTSGGNSNSSSTDVSVASTTAANTATNSGSSVNSSGHTTTNGSSSGGTTTSTSGGGKKSGMECIPS